MGADPEPPTPWWERLERALKGNRDVRGHRLMQVATVDEETGSPRCRTVVFRGFVPAGSSSTRPARHLAFTTDARSEKVRRDRRACEVCWWFVGTSEQFRLSGRLMYIDASASVGSWQHTLRRRYWAASNATQRAMFYRPAPGTVSGRRLQAIADAVAAGAAAGDAPPETFLVAVVEVGAVKYLRLTDDYAQVDTVVGDGAWRAAAVLP